MNDALLDFSLDAMHSTTCAWCLDPACAGCPCRHTTAPAERGPSEPERESAAPSAPTSPHATYLGASDVAAILGLDPMRTELDVWCEKTGRVRHEPSDELEAGNDHEAGVIAGAARSLRRRGLAERVDYPGPGTILGGGEWYGTKCLRIFSREDAIARLAAFDDELHECEDEEAWSKDSGGLYRDLDVPCLHCGESWDKEDWDDECRLRIRGVWRGATLDAVAHHRDHGPVALEAKLVGAGQAHEWGPEPARGEGIPRRVLVQVHWQTHHLREARGVPAPIAYVAADVMGTDRRLYEVDIDDGVIADLLDAGREWWVRHVIGGEMPEPTARDVHALGQVYPHARRPLSPFPPSEVVRLADDYVAERDVLGRYHEIHDLTTARLRAALGDAEGFAWESAGVRWRVTWRGEPRVLRVSRREVRPQG